MRLQKFYHHILLAWCLIFAVLFLISIAFPQTTNASKADSATYQRGLELYHSNGCGICHTLDVANTKGIFGPPHNWLAVIAQARVQSPDYHGEAKTAEDYIRESIVNPKAYIVPGYSFSRISMPAFSQLSQEDLDALVYMLSH